MLRIWRSMFWCLLEILAYPYINEVSSEAYDKKLTFILYNNRSDNERYKCTKKTVVFFIQFQLAYIANHLYTINITFFFIQSGEMCMELWIYKDFYKISERGTTGAQHPPDVSGSEPCYHQGNFYW